MSRFILAALAALAATGAFAQSSVQIVGTFDPSIAATKTTYASGASVSQNLIRNNSQGTSQITFKGTEDLGGGLKASFLMENDFDTRYDANGPEGVSAGGVRGVNFGAFGGEQFLALEGGMGKIQIGAANTPTLTTQASRQPFSTKIGGGFNTVLGTGHVRSNNSIVLTSPTFSGFTVAAAYGFKHNAFATPGTGTVAQANTNLGAASTNSTTDANQAAISDVGVFYANGPIAAGVSVWNTASYTQSTVSIVGGVVPSVTQTNMFASYDLGVAKLTAGFHTEKQDATTSLAATLSRPGGANAEGWNLAAAVPLSANLSLLANYGELKDKLAARVAAPQNRKITAVGLKYALSKNTSVYARYVDETNDNISAAIGAGTLASGVLASTSTVGNTAKQVTTTLVGMQTNF